MSVFHTNALAGASGRQGAGGAAQYQIQRSLRFNSADSAYLIRTPGTTGNQQTFTWSCWAKCVADTGERVMFGAGQYNASTINYQSVISFSSGKLRVFHYNGSATTCDLVSTAVFRDYASWMHVVVQVDTTQATASNRVRIYVNNQQLTSFTTSTYPGLNNTFWFNTASIGQSVGDMAGWQPGLYPFNGYLAECYLIDGQALTPSSFGETDATTGEWIPKAYTGTYGTNGFKLNFADNSAATAAALGKDTSGNGNNYTPNNLSVTAGAGNDSMVDSPTSYGTDTGVGGEVRGNYCTLNPLNKGSAVTLTNGNLDYSDAGGASPVTTGTFFVNSGKWYYEIQLVSGTHYVGLSSPSAAATLVNYPGEIAGQLMYNATAPSVSWVDGVSFNYSTATAAVNGDIIGVALNFDTGFLTFYKNGVSQGAFNGTTVLNGRTLTPAFRSASSIILNFGQRPFAYTAPSGFKALCDTNLPAPTIARPSTVMDVKLYTGNGSTQTISGLGFSPDWVWMKSRSNVGSHILQDTVRGTSAFLSTDGTAKEVTNETQAITAFNSDGFSIGSQPNINTNSATYAAWCWDAGSSTVTNTAGTISSQVRANPSAGFSIVTFTAPSSGVYTFGHGLGVAPQFVIVKDRNTAGTSFGVFHASVCTTTSLYLTLNSTAALATQAGIWGSALPTSSVVGLTAGVMVTVSSAAVAYCFAPVAGYSAFGSYIGNGSADGPFVYTGFRPKWILLKDTTTVGGDNWYILDSARLGYNVDNNILYPNTTSPEPATDVLDLLSNGFKFRNIGIGNASATTYIYAAFAESPFAYSRAR